MVIGNLFLMNLFLAILLKNFEEGKQGPQEEEQEDDDPLKEENRGFFQKSIMSMKVKFRRVFMKRDNKSAPAVPQTIEENPFAEDQQNEGGSQYGSP